MNGGRWAQLGGAAQLYVRTLKKDFFRMNHEPASKR
jgi:hypothetical protein